MSEQDNLQEADGKEEILNTEETQGTAEETHAKETVSEERAAESEASKENAGEEPSTVEENTSKEKPAPKETVNKGKTTSKSDQTPEDTDDGLNEIDADNAEDSENEGNKDRHKIPFKDYDKMSLEALADEFEKLVKNEKIQAIKKHVDGIKKEFKTKFDSLLEEKKEEFLSDGGNEIDFYYTSAAQKKYKATYHDYRKKLNEHYRNLEKNLKENLKERLAIIEEIKGLIDVEENINTTYKHFKELQERWRNAGPIPRDKYNNAWNSYHHHVERFYDFLHLNRDLRDMDFKHNLEQKLKIIERAEALAEESNAIHAFRELQNLHKMWKEELGPVAKEHRDKIWERFRAATKAIHDKRKAYFAELDRSREKNLIVKQDIISRIEAIANQEGNSHGYWQKRIKEVEALREEFFAAGKVPLKVNEATWAHFKESVRRFNRKKNAFYKNMKKQQYENLNKKMELIKIAEDNRNSDDFDTVTPLMKKIQSDWKNIGHVPRKDSDKIWKRFKKACNAYFDRFHATKREANKEGYEAFNKKQKLLDELKSLKLSGDQAKDLDTVKGYIAQWSDAGAVPRNKRYIEGKLNKVLDGLFKSIDIEKSEAELIKFDNKLEGLNQTDDMRRLDNELSFIRKKIGEVKSEITQLENNLQFFTNVDDDNPLVQEVHNNIAKHKDSLKTWKTKLKKIKQLYQD